MSRLIDADALRLMKVEECAGHSIEYAMGWKACIEWIKDAPTVPAITLDWLRNMMLEREAEESRAAWVVMREWKKEQEART